MAAVALVTAFGFVGAAEATHPGAERYADSVDSFATDGLTTRAPHGTSGDSAGIELNALGAEDGTGSVGYISLGTGTTDTTGFIIVEFTDNIALPDGGGTDDLTVWEAHSFGATGVDEAVVSVSADGVTFIPLTPNATDDPANNSFTFDNNYDLDTVALPFVKFVKIVNAGIPASDPGAKGFEVDAVEALNSIAASAAATVNDGCDANDDGSDVNDVIAFSDGTTIFVHFSLCGAIIPGVKYRVHFDYTDQNDGAGNNDPDTTDNAACATTSDDTMKTHRGKPTGPGTITDDTDMLWYEVDYNELTKNDVSLGTDDTVLIWVDTQFRGINDRAPTTQTPCSKPQVLVEVLDLTLE